MISILILRNIKLKNKYIPVEVGIFCFLGRQYKLIEKSVKVLSFYFEVVCIFTFCGIHTCINKYFYKCRIQASQLNEHIEQCYPDQDCAIYINWRKSQADLDENNIRGEKIITGKKKKQLAKHVGENISQQQFENDLNICFDALKRCWSLAF